MNQLRFGTLGGGTCVVVRRMEEAKLDGNEGNEGAEGVRQDHHSSYNLTVKSCNALPHGKPKRAVHSCPFR